MHSLVILSLMNVLIAQTPISDTSQHPVWVGEMIERYQAAAVTNPPRSITRYRYRDGSVYYVPAKCCDQFSQLFDDQGQAICAPDGGYTGRGDGRCADFRSERRDPELIWRDSRKRD